MRKEINNLEFNSSSFYWHNILQQLCLLEVTLNNISQIKLKALLNTICGHEQPLFYPHCHSFSQNW